MQGAGLLLSTPVPPAIPIPARLQWFYARAKFYDDRFLLYPVGN